MRSSLDQSLDKLNNDLIEMGTLIEIAIDRAITSLKTQDMELAMSIRDYEKKVNDMEKAIESTSMHILLSQQPVAKDLRLISTSLKLITDMKRIADQALNISEITMQLLGKTFIKNPDFIIDMAARTVAMVNGAMDSFINRDRDLAEKIIASDDEVDKLFVAVRDDLINLINLDKRNGEQAIDFIMIAKYLERIADHAVNIAGWVIFYITGEHLEED